MRRGEAIVEKLVGELLRHWRQRLTREDVGLPPRVHARRSPGLTQEDVAEVAGLGVRRYVDLERGHGRPSADVLDAVSLALRLNPDEQRTLWTAATGMARPPQAFAAAPDPGLTRLCEELRFPAYVTTSTWQVLAANAAVAQWFVDFNLVPPAERNIARWIFGHPHCPHSFVDWAHFADEFVARVRARWATLRQVPQFAQFVAQLRTYPEFERRWVGDATVEVDRPTERRFFREPGRDVDDPGVGLDMVILAVQQPEDGRRLTVFQFPDGYTPPPPLPGTAIDNCPACARAR